MALPAAAGPRPARAPLQAVAREFDGDSTEASNPDLRVYLADLVRPYGNALREDLLAAGAGQAYGEMAEALLADVVAEDEPVDLLVLAFSSPDVQPGRSTALYLSRICPGRPLAFAVCDQGSAAPFTAVRLVRAYARSGDMRRALVVAVEQSVLHYGPTPGRPEPALPDRHSAVAVRFELGTVLDRSTTLRQCLGVGPDEAAGVFGKLTTELPGEPAGRVLLLGSGLAPLLTESVELFTGYDRVERPTGLPLTGTWAALADHLADTPEAGRTIVLADYEPCARTLSTYVVEQAERGESAGKGTDNTSTASPTAAVEKREGDANA
jgi:hypothetical protein